MRIRRQKRLRLGFYYYRRKKMAESLDILQLNFRIYSAILLTHNILLGGIVFFSLFLLKNLILITVNTYSTVPTVCTPLFNISTAGKHATPSAKANIQRKLCWFSRVSRVNMGTATLPKILFKGIVSLQIVNPFWIKLLNLGPLRREI